MGVLFRNTVGTVATCALKCPEFELISNIYLQWCGKAVLLCKNEALSQSPQKCPNWVFKQ